MCNFACHGFFMVRVVTRSHKICIYRGNKCEVTFTINAKTLNLDSTCLVLDEKILRLNIRRWYSIREGLLKSPPNANCPLKAIVKIIYGADDSKCTCNCLVAHAVFFGSFFHIQNPIWLLSLLALFLFSFS